MNPIASLFVSLGADTNPIKGAFSDVTASTIALGNVMGNYITRGIDTAFGALKGFIDAAADSEKADAQLNAVLKSTKGIAGLTADEVNTMANALSAVTPFEDDAIKSGQSMLLTFTNIGKKVFPDATKAMLNLSQATGQDLKASAIQLGKALNDPVAGISALQRVGVSFNATQEEMIKKLVASGQVEQAQAIILKELETEFGGAAQAAGGTFAGQMQILQNQIGNVQETIGGAFLPVLTALAKAANETVLPAITGLVDIFVNGKEPLGDWSLYWEKLSKLFGPDVATAITDNIIPAFQSIVDAVKTGDFSKLGETVSAQMSSLVSGAATYLSTNWPTISAELEKWAGQFWNWVGTAAASVATKLAELMAAFRTWTQSEDTKAQLSGFGMTIGTAIVDAVKTLFSTEGKKTGEDSLGWSIIKMLNDAVAGIGGSLREVGAGIEAGIAAGLVESLSGKKLSDDLKAKMLDVARRTITAWWDYLSARPNKVWDDLFSSNGPGVAPYAVGGVVPGMSGSSRLAIVHGGETITPAGQQPSGITINFYGSGGPRSQAEANVSAGLLVGALRARGLAAG